MVDREEETEMSKCPALWRFSGFILVNLQPLLVKEQGTPH